MKWLMILALCAPCFAQPTITDHNKCGDGVGTGCSASFTNNVSAGHHIVACEGANSTGVPNLPTMTGEAFTLMPSTSVTASPSGLKCYEVVSANGGQKTITGSMTGCSACGFHMNIVDMTSATLDKSAVLTNSTATPWTITSGTTTTANELILAFYYDDSSNATFVAGTGYSILDNNGLSNGNSATLESKTVSSTGAQTATVTGPANGVDSVSGAIMTFAIPTVGPNVGFKGKVGMTGKVGVK